MMARPLEIPMLAEQRSVIRLLLHEGEKPAKIFSGIILEYGGVV